MRKSYLRTLVSATVSVCGNKKISKCGLINDKILQQGSQSTWTLTSLEISPERNNILGNLCLLSRIVYCQEKINICVQYRVRFNNNRKLIWQSILKTELLHAAFWFSDKILFIDNYCISHTAGIRFINAILFFFPSVNSVNALSSSYIFLFGSNLKKGLNEKNDSKALSNNNNNQWLYFFVLLGGQRSAAMQLLNIFAPGCC